MTDLSSNISRLIDGDVSEREAEKLIENILSNPHSQHQWDIYMTIGSAMRGELEQGVDHAQLFQNIQGAIANEPTYHDEFIQEECDEEEDQSFSWLRPVYSFAIGIVLATMGVLSIQATSWHIPHPTPLGNIHQNEVVKQHHHHHSLRSTTTNELS